MSEYIFTPIGHIRTEREKKYESPHQPEKGYEQSAAILQLLPNCNYEQALSDVAGFERIWLLYIFDRNNHWKPKVLVPRGRTKRGVFATRAPYRPNQIGMSCVRLIEIKGLVMYIADSDILDGTPILDIKPYIPTIDSFPEAKAGWVEELSQLPHYSIVEEQSVQIVLDEAGAEEKLLRSTIYDILLNDPFPHPYRRIKKITDNEYVLAIRFWRIYYTIEQTNIRLYKMEHTASTEV